MTATKQKSANATFNNLDAEAANSTRKEGKPMGGQWTMYGPFTAEWKRVADARMVLENTKAGRRAGLASVADVEKAERAYIEADTSYKKTTPPEPRGK